MPRKKTKKGAQLCYLPDECLMNIFSHFEAYYITTVLGKVCQNWYKVAQMPNLWKNRVFVCESKFKFKDVEYFVKNTPNLKSIVVKDHARVVKIIQYACKYCVKIRSISIIFSGKVTDKVFRYIGHFQPQLQEFSLAKCYDLERSWYYLLENLKYLRKVDLCYNSGVTNSLISSIADSCPLLEELNVNGCWEVSDMGIEHLAAAKENVLKSLILHGANLTDRSFIAISRCSKLTTLHISVCTKMTHVGLYSLCDNLENLESVIIRKGEKLLQDQLRYFVFHKNLQNLKLLIFAHCDIDRDFFLDIACNLSKLEVLDAQYCNLSVSDVSRVLQAHGIRYRRIVILYRRLFTPVK